MFLLAAALTALASLAPAVVPDAPPTVRVYVFTAEGSSGQSTDEEKGRLEAVREMRDALAKKKGVRIVNSREEADVVVEVMDREEREGASGGYGGMSITKLNDTIIRLRVSRAGGEASELKGIGQGTWGRAAKDAADRVEKWIHRADPEPHKRGKDKPPSTLITLPVA
jgi:hypothetical protein